MRKIKLFAKDPEAKIENIHFCGSGDKAEDKCYLKEHFEL